MLIDNTFSCVSMLILKIFILSLFLTFVCWAPNVFQAHNENGIKIN